MTEAANPNPEPPTTEWITPVGQLVLDGDGAIHATVRHGVSDGGVVVPAAPPTGALGNPFLLECSDFQHKPEELHLGWKPGDGRLTPLRKIVEGWRASPARHLPEALDLVQSICRAARELDQLRPLRFLISPAQVFRLSTGEHERWVFVPIPLSSASFADFAASSPDVLAWASAEEVLGHTPEWGYLMGAALHFCLVDEPFPPHLGRPERLRRLLMHRAGNAARTRSVLTSACPRSLAATGGALADFITALLGPPSARAMTPTRMARDLDQFQRDLEAPALATAWEAERNPHMAVALLNAFARSAPAADLPWQVLARLREATGDTSGAETIKQQTKWQAPGEDTTLIARIRAIASRGEEGRTELERAVAQIHAARNAPSPVYGGMTREIDSPPPGRATTPTLSEEEFLYLAYVNGRWLGHLDDSIELLKREFKISWYRVVRLIVTARLLVEHGAWREVSWNCREARQLAEKLPDRGGPGGRYALAYLNLLDGIAHLGAVDGGLPPAYLGDALVKLQGGWSELREFVPDPLEAATGEWLQQLTRKIGEHPELIGLKFGAEAFCQSIGNSPSAQSGEHTPTVPWFAEERIFTT